MYVRTLQCLNYSGPQSRKQFAVDDSDTPVTLKQGQGHKTWCELVDLKQAYNNTKFQRPCLNGVCEKANNRVLGNQEQLQSSPLICAKVQNIGIFMTCLVYSVFNNPPQFQLNQTRT